MESGRRRAHAQPTGLAKSEVQPRVLVVDDDPKLLQIYEELLKRHGFVATTCSESARVLSLLKDGPYDVALLDIRMPGLEGTDLLPLMKRVCADLPVILVSAYCDESQASYYLGLGAFAILRKPVSHEAVVDTIIRAVNQQESIPLVLTNFSLREGRDRVYRKLILAALRKTRWNHVKAAALLGVSRYCLMRWVKRLGIA